MGSIDSNKTIPIPTEDTRTLNSILLIIYIICITVLIIIYYVITKNCADIGRFMVLIVSGMCSVLTGLLLYEVKQTDEFKQIEGLLILIQPLMGLKGNLEMTMASRMSTLMNVREEMVSFKELCREIMDDIILVQTQAVVISLVTVFFAILGISSELIDSFNGYNAINLCSISLLTATSACFFLGIVISFIIVFSKKWGHDPDDFATPVAASVGDFVTLMTMVAFVFLISNLRKPTEFPIESLIVIVVILLIEPILFALSYTNPKTRPVLIHGWTPIIVATIISSLSGLIFTHSNRRYRNLATFQPLFNGFAGNCLAVLASRIATSLHRTGHSRRSINKKDEDFKIYVSPYFAFLSEDNSSARTTTLLLIIVIPSQLFYLLLISVIQGSDKFKLTIPFVILYLSFALIQIGLLLYLTYILSRFIWNYGYDPDMNSIPILTATADLSGTLILFLTYYLLEIFGDLNANLGNII